MDGLGSLRLPQSTNMGDRQVKILIREALPHAAMCFGGGYLGEHYLAANCGAACLTSVWNFVARRQLLFVPSRAIS